MQNWLDGLIESSSWLQGWPSGLLYLAAMVVAVRQALDYTSTWRAVGVCIVGWLLMVLVTVVLIGMVAAMV